MKCRRREREPESAPALELDAFVEEYFAHYRAVSGDSRQERLFFEAHDLVCPVWRFDAVVLSGSDTELEAAWPMLLVLIERAPDDAALAYVAAGPLEDFVRTHHDGFGTRILDEARRNARFRLALRGVWGWEELPQPFRNRLISLTDFPVEAGPSTLVKGRRAKRKGSH